MGKLVVNTEEMKKWLRGQIDMEKHNEASAKRDGHYYQAAEHHVVWVEFEYILLGMTGDEDTDILPFMEEASE